MHELSIAMSIVEICTEELQKAQAEKITLVELEIGSLAGIETKALEFSWDVATENTPAKGAMLTIHSLQASARCQSCHMEFPVEEFYSPCPACGEYGFNLTRGQELRVKAITVE